VNQVFDYCVIGAGIVGLSVAYKLTEKYPNASILILEKESQIGQHQTSHNSGVIHAGIYYAPESLKARLCRQGLVETKAFCDQHGLANESCGKLIVATNKLEEERVEHLFQRAKNNSANVRLIEKSELQQLEPNIEGTLAILSPETGIVDYLSIAEKLKEILSAKVQFQLNETVVNIQEKEGLISISTKNKTYFSRKLIACHALKRIGSLEWEIFSLIPESLQIKNFKNVVRY